MLMETDLNKIRFFSFEKYKLSLDQLFERRYLFWKATVQSKGNIQIFI